jgi:hypothetical protein
MNELSIAVSNEKENKKRIEEYRKKQKLIFQVSDPKVVQVKLSKWLNQEVELLVSPIKNKKYRIWDTRNSKFIDFGDIRYEDFTKHKDKDRRDNYLARAKKIKGAWKSNPYSANNLAIYGLW